MFYHSVNLSTNHFVNYLCHYISVSLSRCSVNSASTFINQQYHQLTLAILPSSSLINYIFYHSVNLSTNHLIIYSCHYIYVLLSCCFVNSNSIYINWQYHQLACVILSNNFSSQLAILPSSSFFNYMFCHLVNFSTHCCINYPFHYISVSLSRCFINSTSISINWSFHQQLWQFCETTKITNKKVL
jgi:hypothetical protein